MKGLGTALVGDAQCCVSALRPSRGARNGSQASKRGKRGQTPTRRPERIQSAKDPEQRQRSGGTSGDGDDTDAKKSLSKDRRNFMLAAGFPTVRIYGYSMHSHLERLSEVCTDSVPYFPGVSNLHVATGD